MQPHPQDQGTPRMALRRSPWTHSPQQSGVPSLTYRQGTEARQGRPCTHTSSPALFPVCFWGETLRGPRPLSPRTTAPLKCLQELSGAWGRQRAARTRPVGSCAVASWGRLRAGAGGPEAHPPAAGQPHVPAPPPACPAPGPRAAATSAWGAPAGPRAHLDAAVVDAGRLTLDAAGVAAARAALHLDARRPDQEVGRRGVDLAPRYLVNDRPGLADRGDGFLCRPRAEVNARAVPPAPRPTL